MNNKVLVVVIISVILLCCCVLGIGVAGYVYYRSQETVVNYIEEDRQKEEKVITNLKDTFSNNTNDWEEGYGTDDYGDYTTSIKDGEYKVEISTLKGVNRRYTIPASPIFNFEMSVEGEQDYGSVNATYGLIFRLLDDENYYFFAVNEGYKMFTFRVCSAGEWIDIAAWKVSDVVKSGMNKLSVVADDSDFELSINGEVVGNYTDKTIKESGMLGVGIEEYEANEETGFLFDNFEVKSND